MTVYEIGIEGKEDVFWIATNHKIRQVVSGEYVYIKEIPEYDENAPGLDFIIE